MTDKDIEEIEEIEETDADFDPEAGDEDWDEDVEELDELDDDLDSDVDDVDAEEGSDEDEEGEDSDEALDELEAEELDMLTDDEESETLIVDEAAELRAIRRAEIAMEGGDAGERTDGEFVCQGCFLVLKTSQLANKRKRLCHDCAA